MRNHDDATNRTGTGKDICPAERRLHYRRPVLCSPPAETEEGGQHAQVRRSAGDVRDTEDRGHFPDDRPYQQRSHGTAQRDPGCGDQGLLLVRARSPAAEHRVHQGRHIARHISRHVLRRSTGEV